MSKLQRYSSYKESGVEWLGEIPEHWEIVPGMKVYRENKRKNIGMIEDRVLSLSYGNIIVKPIEKLVGLVPESFETYQIVQTGDIIIRCMDLQNDKTSLRTGFSKNHGIITSAYLNLNVLNGHAEYLYYYLHALDLSKVIYKFGTGLRQNLSFIDFKRLPIVFPPVDEQYSIVNFLNKKSDQIDQAISQKEQLIELLKERRQIVINEAVTRGINQSVPMKDSGVEWIGEIPEDWKVSKLGVCLKPISVKNRTDLPLLSVARERGVILRDIEDKESNHNFIPDDLSNYKMVKQGQFAMNKMKAWQGSYGISDYTGIVSPAYYIFELNGIEPSFFHKAIRSKVYVPFFTKASDGVRIGQWDLSKTRMKEIPFYIPPKDEQLLIVKHIEDQTAKIDTAIELQQNYIAKLKEYKATLIDSVVTGKVRVA